MKKKKNTEGWSWVCVGEFLLVGFFCLFFDLVGEKGGWVVWLRRGGGGSRDWRGEVL